MTNWLITGVSGGLGRAIANAALSRGDRVWGTVRRAVDGAAFEMAGGHAVRLDITDEDAVHAAVDQVEAASGGIDRLVNNAGRGLTGAIEETPLAQARALFEINLFGAVAMIQAVLPGMRARRAGHIVNITSVSGLAPWSGTGIYGATKYALECVGQTLAQEVAPFGIRVMNVAPGGLRTGFAGTTLARAERRIDDYVGGAHKAYEILSSGVGREDGDPVRCARAILAALEDIKPPLHLLLGADALHYAETTQASLADDISHWRAVSCGISFQD